MENDNSLVEEDNTEDNIYDVFLDSIFDVLMKNHEKFVLEANEVKNEKIKAALTRRSKDFLLARNVLTVLKQENQI